MYDEKRLQTYSSVKGSFHARASDRRRLVQLLAGRNMGVVCLLRDIHVLTLMGHFSVVIRRVVSSPYGVLERSLGTQDVRG